MPRKRAVTVEERDVPIGNEAWGRRQQHQRKDSIPIVQDCLGRSAGEPTPSGRMATPRSSVRLGGQARPTIWAGGYFVDKKQKKKKKTTNNTDQNQQTTHHTTPTTTKPFLRRPARPAP